MRFGRTVERGFLPVYSVDTEDEAKKLLTFVCGTNLQGEFVASELAEEQTLERLSAFGERLAKAHAYMKEHEMKKQAKKKSTAKKSAKKATAKAPAKKRERVPKLTTTSIVNAMSEPTDIESLRDEMSEWRDNMESNNMEHLSKFEEVSECADALEDIYTDLEDACSTLVAEMEKAPDEIKKLLEAEVSFRETRRARLSRHARLDNAIAPLQAGLAFLDDALPEEGCAEIREALSTIEEKIDECSNVSFPGMY